MYPALIVTIYYDKVASKQKICEQITIFDKRFDQRAFGEHVYSKLESHIGKSMVIGGDLNICLDDIPKESNNYKKIYSDTLQKIMHKFDMVDIWRLKHPDAKRYTRHEKTRFGFTQSRIDFFGSLVILNL